MNDPDQTIQNQGTGASNGPQITSPELLEAALQQYQQGDVLEDFSAFFVLDEVGSIRREPAPLGAVIISQTCDLVRADRDYIQLAKRVRLKPAQASEGRAGKRPRFAHLPALGETDFADLEIVITVSKVSVLGKNKIRGLLSDADIRRFATSVARKYGRFAFPDEVTPWLTPLQKVLTSKARKDNTPLGALLKQIVELRVEALSGWSSPPFELALIVIVEADVLPLFEGDELPPRESTLVSWMYHPAGGLRRDPSQIAERIRSTTDKADLYWLWQALGESLVAYCTDHVTAEARPGVSDLMSEVLAADEFPLSRVRRSEILDLDHLSAPAPQ